MEPTPLQDTLTIDPIAMYVINRVAAGSVLSGELEFEGGLLVQGAIAGNIRVRGRLIIWTGGVVRGRVQVVETPHALLLTNVGGFLPGRVEAVIDQDAPLEIYRNPYLAEAMVTLNMIDTQGGGIKRMFQAQRRRFCPLPDYDLSQPERVMVTLRGRILDVRYTRLLMANGELDLATIMLLDKVQKRQPISSYEAKRLRAAKLVEGRDPNLLVAGRVAAATGLKAQHIRSRGFDSQYCRDMIVALVREHRGGP